MAGESLLALAPVNSQGGAILTFAFPMLLFLVIAGILWALFAGWDWPLSRRFRPTWVRHFQTAIAEAGPGTPPATPAAPTATASASAADSGAAAGDAPAGDAPAGDAPAGDAGQVPPAGQGPHPGEPGSA